MTDEQAEKLNALMDRCTGEEVTEAFSMAHKSAVPFEEGEDFYADMMAAAAFAATGRRTVVKHTNWAEVITILERTVAARKQH